MDVSLGLSPAPAVIFLIALTQQQGVVSAGMQGNPPGDQYANTLVLPTAPWESFGLDESLYPPPRKKWPTGGDPVNMYNGLFEFAHTVLRSAGRGLDVDLTLMLEQR